MSAKKASLFLCSLLTLTALTSLAETKSAANGVIKCTEQNASDSDGGDEAASAVGTITVQLDGKGVAASVKVLRKEGDNLKSLAFELTRANAKISHVDRKTGSNRAAGICKDASCVDVVETITAQNSGGESVTLNLNDHSYAGWAGSTAVYGYKGGKVSTGDLGHMLQCSGPTHFKEGKTLDDLLD